MQEGVEALLLWPFVFIYGNSFNYSSKTRDGPCNLLHYVYAYTYKKRTNKYNDVHLAFTRPHLRTFLLPSSSSVINVLKKPYGYSICGIPNYVRILI